jgi:uncharacterized protein
MSTTAQLPIFPLSTVLFPGGLLPLRVFEARYMDMARECLKTGAAFGVCLIKEGREVGAPATPELIGCSARIIECDMQQLGVLNVITRGEQRFRIRTHEAGAQGLIRAAYDWIAPEKETGVPAEYADCVTLLKMIAEDQRFKAIAADPHYDSATWVGYRLSEVLPLPARVKQMLLELEGGLPRLQILHGFLKQQGLIAK